MKYVQDSKLTDTLERELVRNELANGTDQHQAFAFVTNALESFISVVADLKATARSQNVQYANG
jgi:hypothetical protein